jgi:C-terminal processing protease CtpA/Prc
MFSTRSIATALFAVLLSALCCFAQSAEREGSKSSPTDIKIIRERSIVMLGEIKQILKAEYFDRNLHGIDIDARFKMASEKIKSLETHSAIFKTIAELLLEFNDSHTVLLPPNRADRLEYGFTMQAIGENVFVIDVKKGSDAEAKGLRVGDVVRRLGKHDLSRQNLKQITYFIYYLEPQDRLRILTLGLDNVERELVVFAEVKTPDEKLLEQKEKQRRKAARSASPYKCKEVNKEIVACRLESFLIERKHVDKMMSDVHTYKKMVLDLRGNRGGYVSVEEYLTGHFFDREVKIATTVTRGSSKDRVAKPRKEKGFKGELLVLIDSRSASASEVFARVIQLEKRGRIVGDTSSGAVMTATGMPLAQRYGSRYVVYSLNVTVSDMIMSDGNRLEHLGVVPDLPVGPSREALRARNDPVLAYAIRLMGQDLSSAEAAKFNFLTKTPEFEVEE